MISTTEIGLPFEVESEDGIVYEIDAWRPTMDDLEQLWNRYSKYNILFSDFTAGNREYFNIIMLQPSTIILVAKVNKKEVGILYVTDIRAKVSADAHYFFWDKKTNGRQKLILHVMKWTMTEFELHRVNTTVPEFAYSALHRLHRMGMRIEGRRHEAILTRGKWVDMFLFGVVADELTEEVLAMGQLKHSNNWHGLLDNDEKLKRTILNRKL